MRSIIYEVTIIYEANLLKSHSYCDFIVIMKSGHRLRLQQAEGSTNLTYPNIMQSIEYEVTIIYEVTVTS